MLVFAIETSCDETSVAIVKNNKILSLQTYFQQDKHSIYGGVVPEIAAREHIDKISQVATNCFKDAGINPLQIDCIAVTASPGLIGALLVGITFAKGLALALSKPLKMVNHLDGHIFTTYLSNNLYKNFYCLLISGGHCQTIKVKDFYNKQICGQTIDDSVGEAFDKLSKKLGLGYPGGKIIEELAIRGNPNTFAFKIPLLKSGDKFNFSFSGLKTHFLNIIKKHNHEQKVFANIADITTNEAWVFDLCASFQKVVADILINRVFAMIQDDNFKNKILVICGGVSANRYIKKRFENFFANHDILILTPPIELCTDNAAMIAAAAIVEEITND